MNRRRSTLLLAVATAVVSVAFGQVVGVAGGEKVPPAYCVGRWYPGDAASLATRVDDLLSRASLPTIAGKPIAVISPHAGYQYSAPVAAAGYACLKDHKYKRVIAMAFSHQSAGRYQGVDVPAELTAYKTPLGDVPIDRQVCDTLLKSSVFLSQPDIDKGEHSLELQLPFLQRVLKDFHLVPLLVGKMSADDYAEAAKAIVPFLDDDTLLVASSDFTHFGDRFGYKPFSDDLPNKLRDLGDRAAAPILRGDFDGFIAYLTETHDTICGRGPIALLLRILSMQGGAEGVRAAFDTSGDQTGDWSGSVTYQSIVFTRRPGTLGQHEREELLKLARQTVTSELRGEKGPEVEVAKLLPGLRADGACFVTLENHGRLRGCIGNMIAQGPLYQAVIRNAVSACHDRRFIHEPVTGDELGELDIEISYLTPMRLVKNTDDIVVGRHGLHISLGGRRGVLLPQVAYERGWTREAFLEQVCHKAGLPLDSWKRPEAEIHSFEAEVFGEPEK